MEKNREIEALLQLIDDPDLEVFSTVEDRLLAYGAPVIPTLENLWENTISEEVQERIEMIIHRIHFRDLKNEFINWSKGECELLYGALLVAKYQYPDIQTVNALQEIERIRRNIWLEMNSYMTPLEQVKIVESILYNYYKMRGGEIAYDQSNEFMLHKVIETKKGNAITTGILYLLMSELLDLPVRAINLPRQFVLGWYSHQALFDNNFSDISPAENIKFYIDPNSGAAFSQKDIELYLKRINLPATAGYFKPMQNRRIIQLLLEQFGNCFDDPIHSYKKNELLELAALIEPADNR
ncbi:MAG: transglutaminase-like domain-containing protein [Bacteroidota bacterium]